MGEKGDGFLLSLKVFSWETDLCVTLCDLKVKNPKIGNENLYLTDNRLSRNEMWCGAENHTYMCRIYAKGFLDLNYD